MKSRIAVAMTSVLVAALFAPSVASSAQEAEPFALDLAGTWRFQPGDDLAWAAPDLDDSGWQEVAAPASYAETGQDDPDWAWYRLSVDLPAAAAGTPLVLELGPIDDADETFFNGELIGKTGQFPPEYASWWEYPRVYPVPADLVRWGQTNVIAVRVHNGGNAGWDGAGGIFLGPLGLNSREHQRAVDLGVVTSPASPAQVDVVTSLLIRQAAAIAAGDVDAYLATLSSDFFHDGHTADRRREVVTAWLERGQGLTLIDAEVEVAVAGDGTLIGDVVRSWEASNGSDLGRLAQARWDVLHVDPATGLELGNRSRYYEDGLWSQVEDLFYDFQVYLPPAYAEQPGRRFPVTYLLHGANGGPREWEWRYAMPYEAIHERYDVMFATDGYEPMIVVSVDAGTAADYGGTWSTMFATELVPAIDASLRTVADRSGRGLTGFSMGGAGVFTNGFGHEDVFGSLATHAAFAPTDGLSTMATQTPDWLGRFAYYMDAGADDAFRGGEFVRAMSAELTAKLVAHEARVPPGAHDAAFVAPALEDSFCSHSRAFRGEPFSDCGDVPDPAPSAGPEPGPAASPAPGPQPDATSLPATGGGAVALALLALGGAAALTRRSERP